MANKNVAYFLSKSQFIRGMQCHKSLWLQKYRPEFKDELSEEQESIFQNGTDVGLVAQGLFPGGIEVPYEGLSHSEQIEQTRLAIDRGIETIYEATFVYDGIFVKADILHKGKDGWAIFEVKGSTAVKDVHLYDAALQYHVLTGAGIDVQRISIVHINNSYIKCGKLEVAKLFTIEDISVDVLELQPYIREEIQNQRIMLQGDLPTIDIGSHCSDPYECDFSGHCWGKIPEDSVFDLRGRGVDKFDLYRQGIILQAEIPLDCLNASQRLQVESTLAERDFINRDGVREFLDSVWYPLCFLDFETFMNPIPVFDGTRPYQQVPFQFSLHIQHGPGLEPEHHEFLGNPGYDPRSNLLESIMRLLPTDACIIAWHQSFEIRVLRDLAHQFPAQQQRIETMANNFRDLMVPFRDRTIYLWQTKGSYSIKAVLPSIVPELSYEGMEIGDGGAAMNAWHEMNSTDDPAECQKIRTALLDYCRLDTLAMVRILERMRDTAREVA